MPNLLLGLASVVVVGVLAQWLAWRIKAPAILVLLIGGVVIGGATGWVDPDLLLQESLFPIVSLSVAIILFEGGLSLDIAELGAIGRAVRNLITVGVLTTWLGATLTAHLLLGFDWPLATLLGAILIVTGPTVIMPLLRQIRPAPGVASIVRWEGLVNDPIGAIAAVLVFEVIHATSVEGGALAAVLGIAKAIGAGGLLGVLGAAVIVLLFRRHWIPDFLQSPFTIGIVLGVFALSDVLMAESGLLAVTVMGSALASQKFVSMRHILEFKENLRVLLISTLFVLLAARLPLTDPVYREPGAWIFIVGLILVVRPLSIVFATLGSGMTWKEAGFLAVMAPRGIVAAAVASVFSIELTKTQYPGAERLAPVVFMVIIGTVVVYGLAAGPVARLLGIATPDPQGLLFVGAGRWVRDLAHVLAKNGIEVRMIDANWRNVTSARQRGLKAQYGNVLSERVTEELPLDGLGRVLAVTPNDEVNALTGLHLGDEFGRDGVYGLRSTESDKSESGVLPQHLQARPLFGKGATYSAIERRHAAGAVIKATPLTETFDEAAYLARYKSPILMFVLSEGGKLRVIQDPADLKAKAGQVVVALVDDQPDEASTAA